MCKNDSLHVLSEKNIPFQYIFILKKIPSILLDLTLKIFIDHNMIDLFLTPKGPSYIFWQHRFLGRYVWLEILLFFVEIFAAHVDEENLQGPTIFITYDYIVKKLLHDMLFLSQLKQSGQIWKNHF